jgi:protein-S-isoprenylcysteine O-methyltransferase Ste14
LVLLNAKLWFFDPYTVRQLVSWILLIVSLFLAVHSFRLLKQIGQPDGRKGTIEGFEKTTRLVTVGAYHYIRHPMYSSLLGLGWGAFLKGISLYSIILVIICTAALIATAKVEEAENLERFGEKYTAYMQRTKMFIPYLL